MPIHGYPGNVISATPPSVTPAGASGVFTTEQQMQYQTAGNWPMAATQISRSLRFNSADSAYLNRTPASASNRKTWTISFWIKRAKLGSQEYILFAGSDSNNRTGIRWNNDNLEFEGQSSSATQIQLTTSAVYRDVSAWYHVVYSLDTTQATSSDRAKIYVNGTQVTAFGTSTYPSQNANLFVNSTNAHDFGRYTPAPSNYLNGYMTEVNFIDGYALTPASFGQTNSNTGIWEPRQYTGPYGTNGFYLNFSDNSGTTSTTLGKDYSGNGNNWTPNNFSVTAGAGNDSLVDTPTSYGTDTGAGGEVRGNYCTLNPLNKDSNATLANGNLDLTTPVSTYGLTYGTIGVSSGKWYWEVTPTSMSGAAEIGIGKAGISLTAAPGGSSLGYVYVSSALKGNGGYTSYGATYTTNDVIGIALDLDAGTLVFYKNNSSQGTAFSSLSGEFFAVIADSSAGAGSAFTVNFGQRPFAYTAPSGFKALCTQNLPTPTIGATSTTQAQKYFDTTLYTGNGTNSRVITTNLSEVGLAWVKIRSGADDHRLANIVTGGNKHLKSNTTEAESSATTVIQAFSGSTFTVGTDNSVNANSSTYVAWSWAANGAGSSNTSGTITSTVSANTTAGFSIVTYTGNGTSGATVGHGLGATPAFVIIKDRGAVSDWRAWATYFGTGRGLSLNSDTPTSSNSEIMQATPTSTLIYLLGSGYGVNNSGNTYVAYCFTAIAGYSAFGTWVGNGSADGPFIYTGFRPRYLLQKGADVTRGWNIWDTSRSPYNVVDSLLQANSSGAESTGGYNSFDLLSNGFKVRSADTNWNNNGSTYIYAAFAEFPFKYTLAR